MALKTTVCYNNTEVMRALKSHIKCTLHETLNTLNLWVSLDFCHIGPQGTKVLSEVLKENSTLTHLEVRVNHIGEEGAKYLADGLKVNHTLKSLHIYDNGIGAEGTKSISEALKVNTTLSYLLIQHNDIGEYGAKNLADSLQYNSSLTSLNLHFTDIGDTGGVYLAEAIAKNCSITNVDITSNRTSESILKFITSHTELNKELKRIADWPRNRTLISKKWLVLADEISYCCHDLPLELVSLLINFVARVHKVRRKLDLQELDSNMDIEELDNSNIITKMH